MKCPECKQEMTWIDDTLLEEDYIRQSIFDCSDCGVEVIKSVKTAADNVFLVV